MKIQKRIISIAAASAVILGMLAGCGSSTQSSSSAGASKKEDTGSNLRPLHAAIMTGQLDQYTTAIGLKEGIFEKHGIDLQTTEFVAGINTIDAVVTGTADVGMMADYAAVNRLGNTLEDTDLVFYSELSATNYSKAAGGLYVAPEYANNLKALDGSKGIMTMTGTVTDYFASKALEYLGLDEKKNNLINTDSVQTQLALAQKGDASMAVVQAQQAAYFEKYGWVKVASMKDLGLYTGVYVLAPKGYVDDNAQLLADYLTSLKESSDYINENLDESAKYLESKIGIKADDFKTAWASYEIRTGFSEDAAEHLSEMEEWAFKHGSFPKQYNIRDFIDTAAIDIAFPDDVTVKLDK